MDWSQCHGGAMVLVVPRIVCVLQISTKTRRICTKTVNGLPDHSPDLVARLTAGFLGEAATGS
jgi:hypothetical protein